MKVTALFLVILVSAAFGIDNFTEEFHKTYPLAAGARVSLHNLNGAVRINGWDRSDVKIDAIKRASTRRRLDDAAIVVDTSSDSISIRTRYPNEGDDEDPAKVEYTVYVPRASRLSAIEIVNGALEINGVTGEIKASSINGEVTARGLMESARLSTVNGRLEAAFDRLSAGKSVSLDSVNGSIEISMPVDTGAELEASTVHGGISNDFGAPRSRDQLVGSSLNGRIGSGGARVHLKTVNGGIRIIPAGGRRIRTV